MRYLTAKMHQIGGCASDRVVGAHALSQPVAAFEKGREKGDEKRSGKEGKGRVSPLFSRK